MPKINITKNLLIQIVKRWSDDEMTDKDEVALSLTDEFAGALAADFKVVKSLIKDGRTKLDVFSESDRQTQLKQLLGDQYQSILTKLQQAQDNADKLAEIARAKKEEERQAALKRAEQELLEQRQKEEQKARVAEELKQRKKTERTAEQNKQKKEKKKKQNSPVTVSASSSQSSSSSSSSSQSSSSSAPASSFFTSSSSSANESSQHQYPSYVQSNIATFIQKVVTSQPLARRNMEEAFTMICHAAYDFLVHQDKDFQNLKENEQAKCYSEIVNFTYIVFMKLHADRLSSHPCLLSPHPPASVPPALVSKAQLFKQNKPGFDSAFQMYITECPHLAETAFLILKDMLNNFQNKKEDFSWINIKAIPDIIKTLDEYISKIETQAASLDNLAMLLFPYSGDCK